MSPSLQKIEELVHESWKNLGYDNLLSEERDYIALWWFKAEVNNGAIHQYFFNSSGDEALRALAALNTLGARKRILFFRMQLQFLIR